jgi:3-hydroxyacyl-[acyl-carrier-protein] dehydratase
MLKDDLYIIKNISGTGSWFEAVIELNEQHKIFEGHFPEQPVLPGACMLQMTRELLETFLEKTFQLVKADDIRFSAMVDPNVNKELRFLIQCKFVETEVININAKILKHDDVVCCKIKASFKTC